MNNANVISKERSQLNRGAPVSLAYSPCPNDTYTFAALTNGLLPEAPKVRVALEDIENLNKSAEQLSYEMTKVSYGVIPHVAQNYRILRAGGALGRGCGPLLVARKGTGTKLEDFHDRLVAIPGERTTAFLLLQLAMNGRPPVIQIRFDNIISLIADGTLDAGLIIHESRFTYEEAGLVKIADLGDWWESVTNMPIPLGAILVRNDIDDATAQGLNTAIRSSLAFARNHEESIMPYVREHAAEMDDDTIRKHIALYVNDFSDDIGESGIAGVNELFTRGRACGILPETTEPRFLP